MKKILIGICGIGNGHINRQACVIKLLIENGFEVLMATDKNSIPKLKNIFPNEKIVELTIPWIVSDESGINFKETLKYYNDIDWYKKILESSIKIEEALNGKPDLVITDYEPNVAQYAYAAGVPLITMEQQSKFLYLDEIEIENQSIKEEKYRLNYFFPRYNKKIISSFFPINLNQNDVVQVPPIISENNKSNKTEDFILVYLSPHSDSYKYNELLEIIGKIKDKKFKVYSKNFLEYKDKYIFDNIEYSDFNLNFKKDLSKCSCLVTTAGHQLISEAISLNIPIYAMPLDTYEQNYNALMIEKYKLGTNEIINEKNIYNFISKRDKYIKNIKKHKEKYYKESWKEIFLKEINEII